MVFSCLFHEYAVVLAFFDEGENLFGFLAVNSDSDAHARADDFLHGSLQLVGEHAFEFHVGNSYSGLEWQIACHNGVGLFGTFLDTALFFDECRGRRDTDREREVLLRVDFDPDRDRHPVEGCGLLVDLVNYGLHVDTEWPERRSKGWTCRCLSAGY